jgi:ABC-type transport system substrate-binding protein
VDEHTVDVVCGEPCPTFPRNAIYIRFQAPAWYQSPSEEEQARTTIGFGPYQVVEWRPGVDVTLEAYEGYLPNEAFESRAPVIQNVTQLWRAEALVRAAMVDTGEADWAYDTGFENEESVPVPKSAGTTETYYLSLDTIWHPELMKKQVRQALNHAIDCPAIMDAFYQGRIQCHGNISPPGTLGLTPENSEPYGYDPNLARQLLEEAGYDPENEIRIYAREATAYLNVEFLEAVFGYWREVGINAQLEVMEPSRHQETRRSGCGQFGEEALTCHEQDPPAPFAASSHDYDSTLTNAPMDFQHPSLVRLSCFHVNTRVCDRELEEKINTMVATPEGPERLRLMEELANIAHSEYYFVPFFPIEVVYGLAEGLIWEPRYDPLLRVNTMRWAN